MKLRWIVIILLSLVAQGTSPSPARAADPPKDEGFVKQVTPVLTKFCINCHGGAKPKGDIKLDAYKTDAALGRDRKLWEKVSQVLRNREMPPNDKPQPGQKDIDSVVGWIEGELAKLDRTGKKDPGRVTIRRLNRVEYNNTIRDLVGVTITPADDFPADDVGYGFDNIGDVLSMPPILMEKYLAAADRIVTLAIVTEDALKGQIRKFEGKTLNSSLKGPATGAKNLFTNGEVFTSLQLPADGDYVIRVRAFGQQAGSEPARMTFRIDGKDIQTVDVKALEENPGLYELKTKIQAGQKRISAAFINDFYDPKEPDKRKRDRNLIIEYLEIQGPIGVMPAEMPESHKRIMICRPADDKSKEECATSILDNFASRAYRRPATKQEVARLVYLVKLAEQNGDSFEKGIQLALKAVLVSPHFLFRVELDREPTNPNAVHAINDFELASRLSYFLWSSMPDDELFNQAKQGTLRNNLETQARRMLKDPKARALVDNFAGQWLTIRNLRSDPARYPTIDEPLRSAMLRETELTFETVMKEDLSVLSFLDGDFAFVNERLARHYGIEGVKGDDLQRVKLTGDQRGGLLTQASILTVTSNPTRTSPVKRGKWILENILGTPPPPPPPDVPELNESKSVAESASLRKRMELHRSNAICASCHQRMDPLGFGFENYDMLGAWRAKDGKFDIDPSGVLPGGRSFKGPKELKGILLSQKDSFARCLTEKMLTYALGRGLESYDRSAVEQIVATLGKNDYKFSTLMLEVVKSEAFQKRRGQ